jgi:hypothetical protein
VYVFHVGKCKKMFPFKTDTAYSYYLKDNRPDDQVSMSGRGRDISFFLLCLDWLWGSPTGGLSTEARHFTHELTVHLLSMQVLLINGTIPAPSCLSGIALT